MSQILKFKEGGSSPQNINNSSQKNHSKKYGTFTFDNTIYDVTDDFIDKLTAHGKPLKPDVAYQFSKIIDALKNGKSLGYNSLTNTLTGDVKFDVTKSQDKRLEKSRTGVGNFLGDLWGGNEQDSRNAIDALKGFSYNKPIEPTNTHDWSKGIHAEYAKDAKGNYKTNEKGNKILIRSESSLALINGLRELQNIAKYGKNDIFKGYNNLSKDRYIALANDLGTEGINKLIQNIEDGTWTEEDAALLDNIGYFLNGTPSKKLSKEELENLDSEEKLSKIKQKYTDVGLDYKKASPYVIFDNEGNPHITEEFIKKWGTGNHIFNEDWWKKSKYYDPTFDFLNGWTVFGTNLYRTSDLNDPNSMLYKYAHVKDGFYDQNKKGNYKGANDYINYRWGIDEDFNEYDPINQFSSFLDSQYNKDKSLKWRPLNGLYQLPDGQQLVQYWNNNEETDEFGRAIPKYAIIDNELGRLIQDNVNLDQLTRITNGTQTGLNMLKRINNPDSPYHGRYIKDIYVPGKNKSIKTNIRMFIDPNDEQDVILEMPDQFDIWNPLKGQNVRIPSWFAKALQSNPRYFDNILQNKSLQGRLARTLTDGVNTGWNEFWRTILPGYRVNTVDDWINSGFDSETAQMLADNFSKWGDANGEDQYSRRINRLVPRYMEIMEQSNSPQKFQKGGIINTTKESNVGNASVKTKENYNKITEVAGDKNGWNLSNADKLQIASIAGDVASFITSIPTGGNPIAGAIGAGSSIAQFAADWSRDGLDWGDAGNLLFNLGLDLATVAPFGVGTGAKLAKMGKLVSKSAKVIRKGLMLAGATNAVSSLNKIVSGDATLDDWKNLSTGLFAIRGIKNDAQDILATKFKKNANKLPAKTKRQLKEEFIDAKIKENPELTKYEGKSTSWYDEKAQKVIDYAAAEKGIGKDIGLNKLVESKLAAQAKYEQAKNAVSGMWNNSWNPLSSSWRYNMENRILRDVGDLNNIPSRLGSIGSIGKARTINRLAMQHPHIAEQLIHQGWAVENPNNFGWFKPYMDFNEDYRGWWGYRAPKFTQNGLIFQKNVPYNNNIVFDTANVKYSPTFKKGGKIAKAQYGMSSKMFTALPKINVSELETPVNKRLKLILGNKKSSLDLSKYYDLKKYKLSDNSTPLLQEWTFNTISNKPTNDSTADINVDKLGKVQRGSKERKFYNTFLKNPDNWLGGLDFLISNIGINKVADKYAESINYGKIGSQKSKVLLNRSNFDDNGLARTRDAELNNIRQHETVTSDAKIATADRFMRDQYADNIINKYNTELSNKYSEHKNNLAEINNKESLMNTQIANENKNAWYTGSSQLALNEANRATQHIQSLKNAIYNIRGNVAKDQRERQIIESLKNQTTANKDFINKLNQLYSDEWNTYLNSLGNNPRKYESIIDYIYDKHPKDFENFKNKYLINFQIDSYNNKPSSNPFKKSIESITYAKNGTKMRSVSDEYFLEQQKAVNKAVENLNNNIMKLFLKMMK